jgi:serine phosphatase RsbU (regulator of sigma subunit)
VTLHAVDTRPDVTDRGSHTGFEPQPIPSRDAREISSTDLPAAPSPPYPEADAQASSGWLRLLLAVGAAAGLYWTSLQNYLLFHSFAEMFGVAVAFGVLLVAWNSRWVQDNGYLFILGIASGVVGILALLHTLAYKGMGVLGDEYGNLATQLWIASRYVWALSSVAAIYCLGRKPRPAPTLAIYGGVALLILLSIFRWHVFPDCLVEGIGLTPFKKASEYLLSALLAVSALLLFRRRQFFEPAVGKLVVASLLTSAAADVCFTTYANVYGPSNLVGHYLHFAALCLLYEAVVVTGFTRPVSLLFGRLQATQRKLERANQEERNRVALLQRALLPPTPHEPDGYHIANKYVPALSHHLIGGDFYDVFPTAGGQVGLLLGDVSGKGLESAALAASARSTLRTLVYETSSVADSLRRANALLCQELVVSGNFVTVALLVLDPGTGRFTFACAGHPSPVLYTSVGPPSSLPSVNLALGIMDEWDFQESSGQLGTGDQLVLYSDGLDEVRRGGQLLGRDGVLKALGSAPPAHAQHTIDRLLETSERWSDGRITDDTTLLVCERR